MTRHSSRDNSHSLGITSPCDTPLVTKFAAELATLMQEQGENPTSLSRRAGLGVTAVRDILEGRSSNPRLGTVKKLAQALNVKPDRLIALIGENDDAAPKPTVGTKARAPRVVGGSDTTRREPIRSHGFNPVDVALYSRQPAQLGAADLPVYASAEGGPNGSMMIEPDPIQHVRRPEPLENVRDGHGVLVIGDSMSPAYDHGDMALIHPKLPPMRGRDFLFIKIEPDGTQYALLKRLVRWNERTWFVKQFNPPQEFELSRDEWQLTRRVVGRYTGQ